MTNKEIVEIDDEEYIRVTMEETREMMSEIDDEDEIWPKTVFVFDKVPIVYAINVCVHCESIVKTEPLMCHNCKDYDGIMKVRTEDWNNEELTFQEIIDRNGDMN